LKCIVFCSGKGGTGKSCVAAYTGAALANAGKKTLVAELGSNASSLEIILGVRNAAFGALDILAGRCDASEAMVEAEKFPQLMLMPSGGSPGESVQGEENIRALLGTLYSYDFVIVDGADLSCFPVGFCSTFVLVATPDTLSVQASAQLARQLYRSGARDVRLIINHVPARIIPISGAEDFDDVIDVVGAQLLGVIPASPKLAYCSNNEQPLDPESITVKVFENIAGRLMGQRRPLLIR